MRPVRRILFLRTDRIGDVLLNLPAIRSLRLAHPKAWLALWTSPAAAELLRGHPDLDEVQVFEPRFERTFAGRLDAWRRVRSARFDLAVVSNPSKFLHALVWAGGIPVRAGHARKGAAFLNRRLRSRGALEGLHEIERNLKLAEAAGGAGWDGRIELPRDEGAEARMRAKLAPVLARHASVVVVHPGTSHPKKRWPEERFSQLCSRIVDDLDRGVIVVGGPEEAAAGRGIAAGRPDVFDWTGQTSLRDLTALFRHPRVSALVSSDSGPVHVAWIAGAPVVALYASDLMGSDPRRWGPRDACSAAIHRPMVSISAEEVSAALSATLARRERREART